MRRKVLKLLQNDTFIVLSLDMILIVSESSLTYKKSVLKETSC